MKNPLLVLLFILSTLASADPTRLTAPLTSVKLKGHVDAVMFGTNPSCYPDSITLITGLLNVTDDVFFMAVPTNEQQQWFGVSSLNHGLITSCAYLDTVRVDGADVLTVEPEELREIDLTRLFNKMLSDPGRQDSVPYCVLFFTTGDTGKLRLHALENINGTDRLMGLEVVDSNGTKFFQYNKNGDPTANITQRLSYTGHRADPISWQDDSWVIGDHFGWSASDLGPWIASTRHAFFFHRGLAYYLGWFDSDYFPNDPPHIAIEKSASARPASLALGSSPNPFSGSALIRYALEKSGPVELALFDIQGRKIRTLINSVRQAGDHSIGWDGKRTDGTATPKGVCLLRLKAGNRVLTRSVLHLN